MTRIIGTPPKPPRGATFADVPIGHAFIRYDAYVYVKEDETRARNRFGNLCLFGLKDSVTLLHPVDPEPDPAVTTPEDADNGQLLIDNDGDLSIRVFDCEHALVSLSNGEAWTPGPLGSFRRVNASVVIHEEPGTHVRPGHRGHYAYVNGGPVGKEELRAIVQQGAALLAEHEEDEESARRVAALVDRVQAASPESEPKPAEDRSKPAPGCKVHRTCAIEGPQQFWAEYADGSTSKFHRTLAGALRDTWDWHKEQDR